LAFGHGHFLMVGHGEAQFKGRAVVGELVNVRWNACLVKLYRLPRAAA
jgi:hypothetical protein